MEGIEPPEGYVRLAGMDTSVYGLEAIFRTCYKFTDRVYLYLSRRTPTEVEVYARARDGAMVGEEIRGDFLNELVDQRVRSDVAKETIKVRELLVAQAFAEANLIDDATEIADYRQDPLGIGKSSV